MKVKLQTGKKDFKTELLTVFLTKEQAKKIKKGKEKPPIKAVKLLIKSGEFTGEFDQSTLLHPEGKTKRILLIGLGEEEKFNLDKLRRAVSIGVAKAQELKVQSLSSYAPSLKGFSAPETATALVEGAVLSSYDFDKYKQEEKEKKKKLKHFTVFHPGKKSKKLKEAVRRADVISHNTNWTRDLVNEGGDAANPEEITRIARKVSRKSSSLKIRVLDESWLRKKKMNLILRVGEGSKYSPRMVVLEYRGKKTTKKQKDWLALAGKGITFDSGGMDLKPPKYMKNMRLDKAGALTVLGIMKTLAQLKPKINVVGLLPLCENMIGPEAYKPGEVIKSYSGKTVEVGNTDAEGRLILGDVLTYAEEKYKPQFILDFATLTGSILTTFGEYVAGMTSTDDKLAEKLFQAGQKTYERVWRLPLYEEYKEEMKGDIADVKNLGYKDGSYAGAITASAFLGKFVEDTPWLHLDIAGTAWYEKDRYYIPKNATGFGLRLTLEFLKGWEE